MIRPVPKPTKKRTTKRTTGLSDSHLLKLHREAVRKRFQNQCFFCGSSTNALEAHHIVKRKNLLLRYDWRNGVLVCKYGCHQFAETPEGKHLINKLIEPYRDYLQERSGQSKDWFAKNNLTRTEFLQEVKKELDEYLLLV
jgi:hypothetical protein